MKKVSIIVPVYNVEKYLRECVDCILAQTHTNLEVLLIDDGSTDNSGRICDEYQNMDSRVQAIHQKNSGAAVAKNTGLDVMTGDYFTFVDSDDIISLDRVEKALRAAEQNNAEIVECRMMRMYKDSNVPLESDNLDAGVCSVEEYMERYLNCWSSSLFCNKLFSATLSGSIRFRNERRCIDDEFYTYKLVCNAKKIVKIDDCLYTYRQRISSAFFSEKNQRQQTDDALEVMIERYKYVTERFPKLAKTYIVHGTNILHYFAKEFLFDKQTAHKLKQVGRFYLSQQILHPCGLKAFKTVLSLLSIPQKQLLSNKSKQKSENKDRYYS